MAREPISMAAIVARLERQGETIDAHMRDCTKDNAAKLLKMTEIEAKVDKLDGRFEAVDRLFKWMRRAVGTIVLAVATAAASVLVQNYLQHQQTQAVAVQASQAAVGAADQTKVINNKLDKLIANQKETAQ